MTSAEAQAVRLLVRLSPDIGCLMPWQWGKAKQVITAAIVEAREEGRRELADAMGTYGVVTAEQIRAFHAK